VHQCGTTLLAGDGDPIPKTDRPASK
jgi:hypothetical protein